MEFSRRVGCYVLPASIEKVLNQGRKTPEVRRLDNRGRNRWPRLLGAGFIAFNSLMNLSCETKPQNNPQDIQNNGTIVAPLETVPNQNEYQNPPVRPIDNIAKYITDYIEKDLGARTTEKFEKKWEAVVLDELVQIVIEEPQGIFIRDFIDFKEGRRVRNTDTEVDSYWKALNFELSKAPIPGLFRYFVIVRNPKTMQTETIWAVSGFKKDPSDPKGGTMEFIPVYNSNDKSNDGWYASFIHEGKEFRGPQIFGSDNGLGFPQRRNSAVV